MIKAGAYVMCISTIGELKEGQFYYVESVWKDERDQTTWVRLSDENGPGLAGMSFKSSRFKESSC